MGKLTGKLTTRQRRILIILGAVNLIAVLGVALVLLREPSQREITSFSSHLAPQRIEACRQATSDALFQIGHSGMVHTRQDGTILVQIQRPIVTENVRLDMDASTWAALEAITHGGDCLRFEQVEVTVDYASAKLDDAADCASVLDDTGGTPGTDSACQPLQATAHVKMDDLVLWSLGEIDDDQLSIRLDYQLPATLAR